VFFAVVIDTNLINKLDSMQLFAKIFFQTDKKKRGKPAFVIG
jgi:hypothetical protein